MKLALFKNIEYDFEIVSTDVSEGHQEYVRVSEYVDVDFPRLDGPDVVLQQIERLREQKKRIQAGTEAELNRIDQRIGDLLALEAPEDE